MEKKVNYIPAVRSRIEKKVGIYCRVSTNDMQQLNTAEVSSYFDFIKKSNGRSINADEYVKSGGWSARKNGRDLADNPNHCSERIEDGFLIIEIENPASDWQEWIKTIDIDENDFSIQETKTGYTARLKEVVIKKNPLLGRLFRQVFHKAACCNGCQVCKANCPNGAIRFVGNRVSINGCVQCHIILMYSVVVGMGLSQ
ncbi:hypothetical protein [Megasphaera cerevisiae]|uniref:hypothetical protein n=1 Tax=Megasphaera cerevisiae TaxID=39029 RepID=UPI0009454F0D|nr:hypothetical protein [Megasphaera cerevisiae]OKY53828.1 hypothetical protein BSR42_05720 [Megasphaera cerevisiae]